jgi:hypothetical protein
LRGRGGREPQRVEEVERRKRGAQKKGKRRSGAGLAGPALKRQNRPVVGDSLDKDKEANPTEQAADGGPETTPKKAAAVSTARKRGKRYWILDDRE